MQIPEITYRFDNGGEMDFNRIISVHGAPRSGTTWLGQILNSSPRVKYKFQPFYSYAFRDRIDLINKDRQGLIDFYNELYHCHDVYIDRLEQIKNGISPEFMKNTTPDLLVVKEVRFHFLIPHLLKNLDNIIFVTIVRNPCGALNSWRKAPREFWTEWNFKDEWRFAQSRNQFKPGEYYGFHRWKEANKLFLEMGKNYPEKFLIVKYEDLVNRPDIESRKLFSFCGVDLTDQTIDFINQSRTIHQDDVYSVFKGKQDLDSWKTELDAEIIEQVLNELKGTEFQRFLD
jgi:hypothetical protein